MTNEQTATLNIRGLDSRTYDQFRFAAKALGLSQPDFLNKLLVLRETTSDAETLAKLGLEHVTR